MPTWNILVVVKKKVVPTLVVQNMYNIGETALSPLKIVITSIIFLQLTLLVMY
jgi:hypothetical protein